MQQSKLQQLTDKLYQEGVSKANKEAEEIIENARKESESIKKKSKDEADSIKKDADRYAAEIKKKTETELKQAADQTKKTIMKEVTNMITAKVIDKPVDKSFQDNDFLKKVIETAVKNWDASAASIDLKVMLPEELEKKVGDYLKQNAGNMMKKGLEIEIDPSVKAGFKIGPADGSYQISFKEEDFENLFKKYLRPKTIQFLYGGK